MIVSEWAHARTRTHARTHAQVDVIVSEWMGFYLFHESMLDSVLNVPENRTASSASVLSAIRFVPDGRHASGS